MMKRVKQGLSPVPSEQEERERIRRLKEEEKETQQELSGMIYKRDDEDSVAKDGDMNETHENHDSDNEESSNQENSEQNQYVDRSDLEPSRKKKARSKPVPDDYVCYACNNKYSPLHWIYDCPDKIHNPGSNNVKKKIKGINEPSERKVFVSGLPFDIKAKDVEAYFEKEKKCGKVIHCKLLLFPDTKRCKGTGFITFDSDEGARNALKLNGTALDISTSTDNSSSDKQTKKHTLTLCVKRVLSRTVTKNKKL
jgi:RNA recognition motif-containing protein